jgi:LuxR family transcriptional regulator, maltose regulon positive regulatory protein
MTPTAGRAVPGSRRDRRAGPAFELDEFKLRAPPARPGMVTRAAIIERLVAPDAGPVLAVVAPAGYGKTTLLAQLAQHKQPRVAWVSADDRDNDPTVLLTYLAVALDRVEPIEPSVFRSLASPGVGLADVARLGSSIASMGAPIIVVLDHAEAITSRACRDMIAELAVRLPAGSQLAIGSRQEVPVPVPRLRAQGGIVEIGVGDLAMDPGEAQSLLASAGVAHTEADIQRLVERTEGWPAGLYLAALAMNAGGAHMDAEFALTGDERFVGDYLRSEFLDRVSRAEVSFLTRTSILDRMLGPLCDVTVGGKGSGHVLDRLQRRNLLVIPLDRHGQWYRYHQLFRELLHAELQRREPELVGELHTRAAAWFEANNLTEAAIGHAQYAGDAERVARLVLKVANQVWASGRLDTVLRWMEWFSAKGLIEHHPAVAVHGALIYALVGKAGDAERWASAAERTASVGTLPDGNTMEGSLAYLRALLCRDGLDEMRRDAQTALRGLSPTSPYRPAMLHADGVAHLLEADLDQADLFFSRAVGEATSAAVVPYIPVLLAERGIVAVERRQWAEAEALATQALAIVQDNQFDDYWTSALVYAWGARIAARRGDVTQARDLAARAARLRPLLTHALPIVSVQALLELAHAYVALADPGGARAALTQVHDIQQHRPELGTLRDQANQLRSKLERLKGEILGVSSLTTAELRVLSMLPTHLSLAEIGERLYVSRNTIKSQAMSIYRKLGVSTRGESILRMHELGLLAH